MSFDLPASPGHQAQSREAPTSPNAPEAATVRVTPSLPSPASTPLTAPDLFGLFDRLGDAVLVVDRDWRIVGLNAAAARLFPQPASEHQDLTLWQAWPDMGAELRASLRHAANGEATLACEQRIRSASGEERWLDVRASAVETGLIIIARDVTALLGGPAAAPSVNVERERREERAERLQELTAALSAALDSAAVGAAIIAYAMPALGANAGHVYLRDDEGHELVSVAAVGYAPEVLAQSRRLVLNGPAMMAEVARGGAAILIGTWDERIARYPHHRHIHATGGDRAVAGLPLKVEGRTIGALSLAFPTDRSFDADERRFMVTVADLCAQALERARLYEAVRRSELRFRQLADATPQIAIVIGADGAAVEYLNRRWFAYTGSNRSSATLHEVLELVHPDDLPIVEARWREALQTGEAFESELRLRADDDSYRWFLSRSVPVRDASGKVIKWFGVSTDIDDTKRAEETQRFLAELGRTLAASLDPEETLRVLARLLVPALADYCLVDLTQPDGQIRRVAWAHRDPAEQRVLDEGLLQLVPPSLSPQHPLAHTLATGEPQVIADVTEEWLQRLAFSPEHLAFMRARNHRSQTIMPLLARGRIHGALTLCFNAASGRRYTNEYVELARDVAERVALAVDNARLYTEARQAEAKVNRLLDAGVIGIFVAGPQFIVEANDHFLTMIGYTREEVASCRLRWPEITPPDFADLDARAMSEIAERGVATPYEKVFLRRDGSRLPILLGAAELQRQPQLWISFVLDLTEQKRAEDDWRSFVDATAHDLRNPLTAVLGQTQLLQRRLRRGASLGPADGEPRLAAIVAAASRAAALIDDLMDTARLRAGQPLELHPTQVDLAALLSSCAEEARRVGPFHVVRIESDASPLVVTADGPRIERVIRNMLDNAIKYSPAGGEVVARAQREADAEGTWGVVTIEDRGLGIPAVDLPHVFKRFHRGGNVAGRIPGSGIGLSGAQQIVEQHGGTIGVRSREGEGSSFTLRLPLLLQGA